MGSELDLEDVAATSQKAAREFIEMHAELEQLRMENACLREAIDEANELDPYDAGYLNTFGGGNVGWWHDYIRSELDRAHDHYTNQIATPAYHVADKPRITEQDARALVGSAMHHYIFNDQNVNIDDWFESEGRALLDKLNEGRQSEDKLGMVPAVSVPENFNELLNRIVPRIDAGGPNPLDPEKHCCEYVLYQERERIHGEFAMLSASPADSEGE